VDSGEWGLGSRKANNEPQNIEYRITKEEARHNNFGIRSSVFEIRYSLLIGAEVGGAIRVDL